MDNKNVKKRILNSSSYFYRRSSRMSFSRVGTMDGKTEVGKTVNGKTNYGKPATSNNNLSNNDLNNNNLRDIV